MQMVVWARPHGAEGQGGLEKSPLPFLFSDSLSSPIDESLPPLSPLHVGRRCKKILQQNSNPVNVIQAKKEKNSLLVLAQLA